MKLKKLFVTLAIIVISLMFFLISSIAEDSSVINLSVGDEIIFGQYKQGIDEQKLTPIEWIVLAKNKNRLTLLSKKVLELMPFHDKYEGAYWPNSSLRKWLNGDFFKTAFSKDEQKAIVSSTHANYVFDNELREKKQNSEDKVFLLNVIDAMEYFTDEKTSRKVFDFNLDAYEVKNNNSAFTKNFYCTVITPYANRDHMFYNMSPIGDGVTATWWLCDTYADKGFASYTGFVGSGFRVNSERVMENHGVRPAIIIDINKTDINKLKKNNTIDIILPSVEKETDYKVMLGFNIDFKRNLLFSKYDVSLYIDNEFICDLKHGNKIEAYCQISKGNHNVFLYKKDDHSVVTKKEISINEHSYMDCSISTNRNGIELNGFEMISRYKISDSTICAYLKEYDAIVDNLSLNYNIGLQHRERSGKTNYTDLYFLLGAESKAALCFIVPKHIYNENPVMADTGYYLGKLSSGKVTVILSGGDKFEVSVGKYKDTNEKLAEFYSVCYELIRYMYPDIHDKYLRVRNYLIENDPKQYELIRIFK